MISEGSCDTENWSNNAKYSDLITGINYILTGSLHAVHAYLLSHAFIS